MRRDPSTPNVPLSDGKWQEKPTTGDTQLNTARAAITLSGLTGGRHKVTATYLGNSTYKGSTVALNQTVN
jgi:hypothetical protein